MEENHRFFILFHACLGNCIFVTLYFPFSWFFPEKKDMDVGYQLGEEEAQIFIKNVNT